MPVSPLLRRTALLLVLATAALPVYTQNAAAQDTAAIEKNFSDRVTVKALPELS